MHKELGVEFPLRDVFRYSTVEEMAAAMERLEIGRSRLFRLQNLASIIRSLLLRNVSIS
ncbi:hypothetical protein [Paenibacillus polymyxa]|uniref:hypothetical protein n=1 Tax=Paenibacillus polymyxa TaxID=1406 RepID=UPI003992EC69